MVAILKDEFTDPSGILGIEEFLPIHKHVERTTCAAVCRSIETTAAAGVREIELKIGCKKFIERQSRFVPVNHRTVAIMQVQIFSQSFRWMSGSIRGATGHILIPRKIEIAAVHPYCKIGMRVVGIGICGRKDENDSDRERDARDNADQRRYEFVHEDSLRSSVSSVTSVSPAHHSLGDGGSVPYSIVIVPVISL